MLKKFQHDEYFFALNAGKGKMEKKIFWENNSR